MRQSGQSKIHHLRSLASQPQEQAGYALSLIEDKNKQDVIQAALRALAETPYPEARPALLRLYAYYAEHGEIRDPGAYTRAAIVNALRYISQPADISVFEKAADTYERLPPTFSEEAIPLRVAALLAINELDAGLASFHGTRLLADEHTNPMSGEPAMTAVRVLATNEVLLPLYYYVMQDASHLLPELTSECLRHLLALPASLIPGVIERYASATSDMVLAGLFDLLVEHESGPQGEDFLIGFLRNSHRYGAYRYLVTLIVASSKQILLPHLLEVARFEQKRDKVNILVEALTLLEHDKAIAELLGKLRARL